MESDEIMNGGAQAPPDLSAAIGKLMAHPEILQMAASVLQGNGNAETGSSEDDSDNPAEENSEAPSVATNLTVDAVSQALPDIVPQYHHLIHQQYTQQASQEVRPTVYMHFLLRKHSCAYQYRQENGSIQQSTGIQQQVTTYQQTRPAYIFCYCQVPQDGMQKSA